MILMTAAVPADPTAMGCVNGLRRLGQDRRRLKITVPAANQRGGLLGTWSEL